ncbi:serine/threonine-protein kinase [Inhella gelatinilytica]|uniref:Serine/threonine protein kinase n=1 Tax=Inhella gelatinilytica TaxID=2795030 RepID=A0A931ISH8_9BURK|nr:serine/threonine-protein kinase [Inhella gelatinilytica]MBH9551875.1 serine/threonine protein kinase [Inhella gelatinilytica]
MNASHWSAVKALFDAALALPSNERLAYVQAAAVSEAVRSEVLSLLAHSTGGERDEAGFLATPATVGVDGPAAEANQRLGAWKLVEPLGSGGMGEVWLARRADGAYEGEAAVKLLKRGMDSAAVLQRFAQERQALARLDHPHIARLYDAGLSPQGLPYFVMERVKGEPLDQAARPRSLPERLDLVLQLADAVAHAHRNLLVHRDLKPSNVLVTGEGQVKLLDFGIAKALDPLAEGGDAEVTVAGPRPFTPSHASPEQVRGEPVSTATDIYSLGVLLYQVLTGQRPYGREARTPQEAARAVLDEAPTRPSALQAPAGDSDWLRTRERLRGDLDNILLKALEKEPQRRYATVDALARDLRAYLGGYPVSAHAPSRGYLLGKFVRRHRLAVSLGGAAVLALAAGGGATAWQAHVAGQARDQAQRQLQAVQRITADLVFRYGDTATTLPGGPQAQEALLKETLAQLDPLAREMPQNGLLQGLRAQTLARLAELLGNQTAANPERADEAQRYTAEALSVGQPLWAEQHRDWRFALWYSRALRIQAQLWRAQGQIDRGLAAQKECIQLIDQALPFVPSGLAPLDVLGRASLLAQRALSVLEVGQLHSQPNLPSLNQPEEALRWYAKAEPDFQALLKDRAMLEVLDRNGVPGDPATAVYLAHQLGTVYGANALAYLRLDRLPEARAAIQAALALRRANVQAEPRNLIWRDGLMVESNTEAVVALREGDWAGALSAAQRAWDTAAQLAAEQGPQSKWAGAPRYLAAQMGRALVANGRAREALPILDRGLPLLKAQVEKTPLPVHRRRLGGLLLARVAALLALGQRAPALQELQSARTLLIELRDSEPGETRDAQLLLAEAAALGLSLQPERAAAWREEGLTALEQAAKVQPLARDHEALRERLKGPAS